MRVIKRIAEHYDVKELPFGRAYTWSPEQVVVERSKRPFQNRHSR